MYTLWDRELGNQLGEFYTSEEALETAWVIGDADAELVDRLVLVRDEFTGESRVIASGPTLWRAARSHHVDHAVEATQLWLGAPGPSLRDMSPTDARTSVPLQPA